MDKTWGPFTGRQLTTIIVTLIVCVLVPGTVWAIDTFSNVAIEDPVTGVKAMVDSSRHLRVGDGVGPLTVDGSVNETAPANFVRVFANVIPSSCVNVYTVPADKALIVRSLVAYIANTAGAGSDAEAALYDGSTCGTNVIAIAISDRGQETVPETFTPGIAVAAGHTLSTHGFNDNASMMIHGYLVPAKEVPASSQPAAPEASTGDSAPSAPRLARR